MSQRGDDEKRRKSNDDEADDFGDFMGKGTPIPETSLSFDLPNADLPNDNQMDLIDQIVNNDLNGPLPRFESIRFENVDKDGDILHNFFNGDD